MAVPLPFIAHQLFPDGAGTVRLHCGARRHDRGSLIAAPTDAGTTALAVLAAAAARTPVVHAGAAAPPAAAPP